MTHPDRQPCRATSRRGFFASALGLGVGLGTAERWAPPGQAHIDAGPTDPALTEYERILSQTDRLHVLGVPRSWSVVQQGVHPFAPHRIAVLPSGEKLRHPMHRQGARRRIEDRIAEIRAGYTFEPADLPPEKLESFLWAMDLITSHYRIPEVFEDWVVRLAARESLGSTGIGGHWGLVHQYQGRHNAPLDCRPVDWWLFLYPDGIDWASLGEEPVHALIGHFGRGPYLEEVGLMLEVMCLTQLIIRAVDDARPLSRMGRVAAARYLNQIAAQCLEERS